MPAPRRAFARIAAVAALMAFALGGALGPAGAQDSAVTIDIDERNDSGVTGTATLTPDGDRTTIRIELEGPVGNNPVNIMAGSCNVFDAMPVFELDSINSNGVSETTIDISLDELLEDELVVNIHASPTNLGTIVACGTIDDAGGSTPETPTASDVEITLATSNSSGVSGTARFTAAGNTTVVAIRVSGVAGSNLAAIFPGTCNDLDLSAAYQLADVDGNGISNSTINVSLSTLLAGTYTLLVSDPAIPLGQGSGLACGEIVGSVGGTTTGPATGIGVAAINGLSGPAIGLLTSAGVLAIAGGLLFFRRGIRP